jgi:hypothetical protein
MVANARALFLPEQTFYKLVPRWDRCVSVLGDMFESNNIVE